jgi:hypothetical protein
MLVSLLVPKGGDWPENLREDVLAVAALAIGPTANRRYARPELHRRM